MIVEDHEDYVVVSDYSRNGGWYDKCEAVGPQYRAELIGEGNATNKRIDLLKAALRERSK